MLDKAYSATCNTNLMSRKCSLQCLARLFLASEHLSYGRQSYFFSAELSLYVMPVE